MNTHILLTSPLEQFEIYTLLPLRIGSFDISFTNASLFMLITAGLVILLHQLITVDGKGYLVPSRWQYILESIFSLNLQMLEETVGEEGRKFLPLVFSLFTFILISNLCGLIPYSYTVNSHLIVTLTFALAIWIGKLVIGASRHGVKLLGMFVPDGVPFLMIPFFIIIEVVGFVIPIISLSVRLFANLMSGHILLKVLFGFSWSMMLSGGLLFVVHFLALLILFLLLGLETAVAMIQAYVFVILTCIYLGDMVHGGH